MGAGDAARTEAAAAAKAAEMLERKAAYARSRATSFAKGAEGEHLLAGTLAPLTVEGWHLLHDRLLPGGGNVDHLVVGRPGVFVLDAKHWTGLVTTEDGFRAGRHDASKSIEQVRSATSEVRSSLAGESLAQHVFGGLVLTHDSNADRAPERVEDILVAGVRHVVAALRARPNQLSTGQVDAALAGLVRGFPAPGEAASATVDHDDDAHPLFKKSNTYLYVTPWSRAGRHRLYVSGEDAKAYGYKDTVNGTIAVTDARMDPVLRGVLAHATAKSLGLRVDAIPKIPTELPGARLLGRLGGLWMTFLVGHRWRKGTMDRLYGWRLNPTDGIAELGFVDLTTGRLHPIHDRPLGKDLGPPERYLMRLRNNFKPGRRA